MSLWLALIALLVVIGTLKVGVTRKRAYFFLEPLYGLLHVDRKAPVLPFSDLIDVVKYQRGTDVVARNR